MILKRYKNISAFSLIEIAIALTVAGLLMAGVIDATKINTIAKPVRNTRSNFEKIDVAMQKFLAMNGRLPCPSRPELSVNDTGAGMEICDLDTFKAYSKLEYNATYIPTCDNTKDGDTGAGYCYTMGSGRDADADGVTTDDKIIQGGVPYKTLGLLPDVSYDGWNIALRYVVSARLINAQTYDKDMGAIYIVNSKKITNYLTDIGYYRDKTLSGHEYFNKLYPAPYGSGNFMLMSSGKNRAGAYIFSGITKLVGVDTEKYDCTRSVYLSTSTERKNFGLDFENCNQDEFFLTDDKYAMMGEDNIQYYLDDIVYDKFSIEPYDDGMWKFSGAIKAATSPLAIVNASGLGRVGIGTDIPSVALDVNGNIKAEKVISSEICVGSDCLYPNSLISNAKCSGRNGGLLVSVNEKGNFSCMNTTFTNGVDGSCASGKAMSGFNSTTGAIECR